MIFMNKKLKKSLNNVLTWFRN